MEQSFVAWVPRETEWRVYVRGDGQGGVFVLAENGCGDVNYLCRINKHGLTLMPLTLKSAPFPLDDQRCMTVVKGGHDAHFAR